MEDAVGEILPLAPSMTEADIRDAVAAVAADPSAAADLEADYHAANAEVPTDIVATIWKIIQAAASVASAATSIASAVALVP